MMTQEAIMQNRHATAVTRFSAMALLGLGALAGTACNSGTPVGAAPAASVAANGAAPVATANAAMPGATPIAVNCGPGQQALIRPSLAGGQAISQVDCVPIAAPAHAAIGYPAAYHPAPQIVEEPVVYRPAPRIVTRTASAPRVVRKQTGRSWQKSAIIIGSSAGVGAGVGGAVKGKKGALIGAAIGGGAATIWDQATRRR
jgi:hypothetical protein